VIEQVLRESGKLTASEVGVLLNLLLKKAVQETLGFSDAAMTSDERLAQPQQAAVTTVAGKSTLGTKCNIPGVYM
jgi:hypothetical protein